MFFKIYNKYQFLRIINSPKYKNDLRRDKKFIGKIINYNGTEKTGILGYCRICKKHTWFLIDTLYAYNGLINYREWMICVNCGLNNRQRFLLNILYKRCKLYKDCKIYIYEQVTPFYKTLIKKFPDIIGSEYLDSNYKSGTIINGIRHEDSTNLSFDNNSFNILISLDVFEHVFDFEQSIKEVFRVLKPKGRLLFSIPFYPNNDKTEKRADIDSMGEILHNKEPVYHGNPVSNKGALVVYDFSWDIFDILKNCGFKDIFVTAGYNRLTGNIGSLQYFFEAVK